MLGALQLASRIGKRLRAVIGSHLMQTSKKST